MTFNSHNIVSGQSGPFVLINVCRPTTVWMPYDPIQDQGQRHVGLKCGQFKKAQYICNQNTNSECDTLLQDNI